MRPFRIYLGLLLCATILLALLDVTPHLRPREQDGLPTLTALLADVEPLAQRSRVLGYERSAFGSGWAAAGACTVREEIIATQLTEVADPCEITDARGTDPYTGGPLLIEPGSPPVEVDHILPLSAAWDLGAHAWDLPARVAFANDPLNLVATSQAANREKSDHLAAAWLPADPAAHCWYARRLALVAGRYTLPLPEEDLQAMRKACRWSG